MNIYKIKKALDTAGEGKNAIKALFAEGRNPEKWQEIKHSEYYIDVLGEIHEEAEKYLNQPICSLPYSLYKIYAELGSRKEYEREYFKRRARLNTFAILSMLHDDTKYISALEDTIWAICDEYTWCVPAHMNSTSVIKHLNWSEAIDEQKRLILREHRKMIDLFAVETGFALSEILSLLEEKLASLVVFRARKEIKERILGSFCEINSLFRWETMSNNWAAVCAASVGAAAMYLIDDSSVLAPILHRVISAMDCFLSGFKEDGACTEGLQYWNYGFGFYVSFAALLRQRTSGEIDLLEGEKVKQIALFHQKCFLSENKVVSFSDSTLSFNYNPGIIHYLKGIFQEVEIPDEKYRAKYTDDSCYRWAWGVRNLVWSNPIYSGGKMQDSVYYMKDSEWLISKSINGSDIVCFAAKGGNNYESHNHNDVGNFILHVNGESLLTDLGAGEYTKQYFGPERYSFLCNNSLGHSVPLVEGCGQGAGAAVVMDVQISPEKDLFILDISRVYKNNNLKSLVRSFVFNKTGVSRLILKDEYSFQNVPTSVIERLISFRQPELISEGTLRLIGERGSVDILFNPEEMEYSLCEEVFVNHHSISENIYIINLSIKKPDTRCMAEIQFMINKMGLL